MRSFAEGGAADSGVALPGVARYPWKLPAPSTAMPIISFRELIEHASKRNSGESGRDERVEIDQHPTIQSDECARIELRIERDANDVAVFVDAEGDTGEVTRERSQILDARLFAPQVGDGGSIGPAHMTNNLTPVIDTERGVSASARDSTEIAEIGNRAVLP